MTIGSIQLRTDLKSQSGQIELRTDVSARPSWSCSWDIYLDRKGEIQYIIESSDWAWHGGHLWDVLLSLMVIVTQVIVNLIWYGSGWGCAKVSVKQVCGVARQPGSSGHLVSPECQWSASAHAVTSCHGQSRAQSPARAPTANYQRHSIIPSECVSSETQGASAHREMTEYSDSS